MTKTEGTGQRQRGGCCLLVLGVVAAFILISHFVPGSFFPLLILIAVGVAVPVLRGMLAGRLTNTYGLVILLSAAVGLALLPFPAMRLVGVVLVCLAAALVPPFAAEFARHGLDLPQQGAKRPRRPGESVASIAVGVCLSLAVVGLIAQSERASDGYYKRYGVPVMATAADSCMTRTTVGGGSHSTNQISCEGSTWQVNGVTVTGDLSGRLAAFVPGARIRAYAIGDSAVAIIKPGDYGPIVMIGKLSSGLLFVPFTVVAIAWIGFGIVRRKRRRQPSSV
jgi:hypothetical protein